MYESHHGVGQALEFTLPNVGDGSDRYTAADLQSGSGIALVLLLRNHYCPLSRRKVRRLGERIDQFESEHVPVVAVLPDTVDRASVWGRRYETPFALLADPPADADAGDDAPDRFEAFGDVQEWVPQTPALVVVETYGDEPTVGQIYSGATRQDCPSVEEMLEIARETRLESPNKKPAPAV
ncbi:redoxin domain-containing protein [Halapricum salinum]|uniref:Peroxiredoxin n=1 Tax=Halapricum salinum TaxID=1457250 RepID=A0A4D6HAE6_9EURY|nr:redoxin domain-containing protein [Halapricum salinum]QCC50501.1 peroxiredoxin [Halapricum salinum]